MTRMAPLLRWRKRGNVSAPSPPTFYYRRGTLHTGVTNDLARREEEHRRVSGIDGHIEQVGRRTTRAAALEWERWQREREKPTSVL